MIYKLYKNSLEQIHSVICAEDNLSIPFDPDNTDYQQFKKDLAEGASLKDAEGNDMTAEQITAFLGELK
jgi:allophanate hydrolase subunit 1